MNRISFLANNYLLLRPSNLAGLSHFSWIDFSASYHSSSCLAKLPKFYFYFFLHLRFNRIHRLFCLFFHLFNLLLLLCSFTASFKVALPAVWIRPTFTVGFIEVPPLLSWCGWFPAPCYSVLNGIFASKPIKNCWLVRVLSMEHQWQRYNPCFGQRCLQEPLTTIFRLVHFGFKGYFFKFCR